MKDTPSTAAARKHFLKAVTVGEILEVCIFFVWKVERGRKLCPAGISPAADEFLRWLKAIHGSLQSRPSPMGNKITADLIRSLSACDPDGATNKMRSDLERSHASWLQEDGTRPDAHPIVWLFKEFTFDEMVRRVRGRWERLRSLDLEISTPDYLATMHRNLSANSAQSDVRERFSDALLKASENFAFAWEAIRLIALRYLNDPNAPTEGTVWIRSALTRLIKPGELNAPRSHKQKSFIRNVDIYNLVKNAAHEWGLSPTRNAAKSDIASSLGGSACDVVAQAIHLSVSRVSNICDEISKSPVAPFHFDYFFQRVRSKSSDQD